MAIGDWGVKSTSASSMEIGLGPRDMITADMGIGIMGQGDRDQGSGGST